MNRRCLRLLQEQLLHISTTRLAQIGYAEINGNIVEVKSIDGFLNEKTPIIVSRITDGTIMVEKHRK